MNYRYDLYGSVGLELNDLERLVAERLGIELSAHDSSYWGPYALWVDADSAQIRITTNFVDEDGYRLEEDFPEHQSFVYLDESQEFESVDERLRSIDGLEHLRTKHVQT